MMELAGMPADRIRRNFHELRELRAIARATDVWLGQTSRQRPHRTRWDADCQAR